VRRGFSPRKETIIAKGQKKSNREIRKPKAEKVKTNASNPSTKGMIAAITPAKS
jgi:hypothetical protein